ncbi:MAG TPA: tRNA (adenosine(37)-N6)-threonylcarbamoyltransferase complex ATPase subunit type 1 TsaE [Micavibrio sp.]|jgi:tRNA threonylcarbamoyladenosine biosynthesis protein TsaE
MEFHSRSEQDTIRLAEKTAEKLRAGDILFLEGDLGMGKSVFARALIRTLADEPELEVPSPTFTLVQTYDAPVGPVWHFDLYRIRDPMEIYELGWEEALDGGIVLIEWPSRLGNGLAPARRLEIRFTALPEQDGRVITLTPYGHWETLS